VVQILKSALKQAKLSKKSVDVVVARYMLVYRNTPHCTTGETPAMLLMGRRLRTRLDLLYPSVKSHVEKKQQDMAARSSARGCRTFVEGESVLVRNFTGEKWIHGKIEEVLGFKHYQVKLADGQIVKRHVDQLLKFSGVENETEAFVPNIPDSFPFKATSVPSKSVTDDHIVMSKDNETGASDVRINQPVSTDSATVVTKGKVDEQGHSNIEPVQESVPQRVSSRARTSPAHLKDFVTK
jgi:hypothetical protein